MVDSLGVGDVDSLGDGEVDSLGDGDGDGLGFVLTKISTCEPVFANVPADGD